MTTDELRELYDKDKQISKCVMHTDVGCDFFTDDYVLWIENKLINILNN